MCWNNRGWSNRQTIDAFVEYADVLFTAFGDKVKYWLTINEQNTMILHPGAIGVPKGGELPTAGTLSTKPPYAGGAGAGYGFVPSALPQGENRPGDQYHCHVSGNLPSVGCHRGP